MIVNCPTCGNSGDWCQACDGIGRIVAEPENGRTIEITPGDTKDTIRMDIQPKPGNTAPGPVNTRRKK